jgi:hypothetical protein
MIAAPHRQLESFQRLVIRPVPASIFAALLNFTACYFRSFVFLKVPIVFWGDHLGFFNDGSRMVLGQLPYRDYFQFVPPGTDLTYALLIKTFGLQMWIPNLVMACLAAITALLMTLIASRLMRGAVILLPSLLLAGFILPVSTDATHHWFSTIAIMTALLVMLDGTTFPRIAAAGALCGLAACFTQTKGAIAVAAFVVYLAVDRRCRGAIQANERWRKCLLLCGMAAAVFAAANVWFIWAAGLRQWLYCLVLYPLRYYPVPAVNNWRVLIYDFGWHGGIAKWASYPFIYATVPLIYIVFVAATWRRWKEDQQEQWDRLLLVVITGLAMFLAIAPAPSVKRLGTASPPAMILLAWLLHQPGQTLTRLRILLGSAAVALAIAIPVRLQARSLACLDLPAGRAAFTDPALYEEYRWLVGNTQPGEYFFGLPPLYYPFHMRNPAAIEGGDDSEYTRPEQVTALVGALESHHVPLLVLRQSRSFLQAKDSPSDHLGPFRAYLTHNYQLTKTFPTGDDVWQRIEVPVPASAAEKHTDAPGKTQISTGR